jgi:hypothetical protein
MSRSTACWVEETSIELSVRDRKSRASRSTDDRQCDLSIDKVVIEAAWHLSQPNRKNMSTTELSQQTATNNFHEVARTIVEFMTDCGLQDAGVNAGHLSLAFEYAYRPLPRFWRDFDLTALVEAISERFPNWPSAVQKPDRTADDVLREVAEILHCHAFDEANAEMIVALPKHARPMEREAASRWIRAELRKRKLGAELRFAQREGERCGEGALQELHCLECAANGVEFERIGTSVARAWRNRALAERQKSGCRA